MTAKFKTFAENTVGYASEINEYLMRQSVISCANSTERDAIPSPQSGMVVYRSDLKQIQMYDGSIWITPPASVAVAKVTTLENYATTSYGDLATAGPAVTVIVPQSGKVRVAIKCNVAKPTTRAQSWISFALSGANTLAAAGGNGAGTVATIDQSHSLSTETVLTGLTPGSTTFTMKYYVSAGSGSTAFSEREISVEPIV